MATLTQGYRDLETSQGTMRVHEFVPALRHPTSAILLFSEIFQITEPIRRLAAGLAGEGYLVWAPEVYHEFEEAGKVLAYDAEGSERGNHLKYEKTLASYDEDVAVMVEALLQDRRCSGAIAAHGVCLGGHLSLRAALHPEVAAAAAFYPTDLHSATLGAGRNDDTLRRLRESGKPLFFVWGRQDPHIPLEGRRMIQAELEAGGASYEWHEFNAAHAFLRDEGHRYDPSLARVSQALLLRFLAEVL